MKRASLPIVGDSEKQESAEPVHEPIKACAWTTELRTLLERRGRAAGFDAIGVAPAGLAGKADGGRFETWVKAGYAGEMEYLKRRDEQGRLLRSSVDVPMPWARSVVVCAMNYNAEAPSSINPADAGEAWIARYAWSGRTQDDGSSAPTDYHDELLARLRRLETELLEHAECTTRCYVDTGPVVERSIAAAAGVGWIGKNTCVLNQKLGSWLLLAVIVTSLPLEENAAWSLASDRCGSCTRCIDACPTDALLGEKDPKAPREMDASRCISYLTIEKKGTIAEGLRAGMGRQVFGCDICQDVCPWNRKAPIAANGWMQPRRELINPSLDWLAELDGPGFKRQFKGSPLERTGRKRLLRNVAVAMGNSGEKGFLPKLNAWAEGEDEVLREASVWARARLLGED